MVCVNVIASTILKEPEDFHKLIAVKHKTKKDTKTKL